MKEGAILPKSKAGVRLIPVPATLGAILVEYLERSGRSADDLIFGRTPSAPFTDSHMRKRARTAWANTCQCGHVASEHHDDECESCECDGFEALEPIGFHECRHSYSTFLDAAGISEVRADRWHALAARRSLARRLLAPAPSRG